MSDELARRISERQARMNAADAAAEAARKDADEIASTVPDLWSKASKELIEAINKASRSFAEQHQPGHHFKWQPQPQPDQGNFARVVICHRDTGMADLSQTVVTVGIDGIVTVKHRSFERSFQLSQVGREDWDLLLGDIYEYDEDALEQRWRR